MLPKTSKFSQSAKRCNEVPSKERPSRQFEGLLTTRAILLPARPWVFPEPQRLLAPRSLIERAMFAWIWSALPRFIRVFSRIARQCCTTQRGSHEEVFARILWHLQAATAGAVR